MKIYNLGVKVVKAGMNLDGTSNKMLATQMANQAAFAPKDNSFERRVASYLASKQPFDMPAAAKAEKIVPENSINYIA